MTQSSFTDADVLRARIAARIAAGLTERAEDLPHDLTERLRVAREQALARARVVRRQAAAESFVTLAGGAAARSGPPWWQRLAIVLPLIMLVAGLVLIREHDLREQVLAAADIDSVLLADDLPPDAYSDPGFAEFLKSQQP
ncbi:DUF3619 family protein [Rubrivivax gelatinosus]|uniref:Uncharacterized protein DUF3619 n=1 Tax=Rubrivivax gelatinosus TaxID=28068 RepID=A0A4R2MH13_RUBGE|nr:DUF3619 family protein [Rubrivivax gelatinosus]MBK1688689.1 hypothetical protein [Rubrivivax gelatinosus]TCP04595.1 uncharacterized protein DUF3619 [Rubrivivax gelatinosus]